MVDARSFLRSVRIVLVRSRRALRGKDFGLTSAGLTFYSGIAVVPALLVGTWFSTFVLGRERVEDLARTLGDALPTSLGAPDVAVALVIAGAGLGPVGALIALFPASLYGEGLRRSFLALEDDTETMAGWRGRLRVLPVLVISPLLIASVLLITPLLARLFDTGEAGPTALGVIVAFYVDWVVLSIPLTLTYRLVGPSLDSWAAATWAGFTAGSFVSGFLQGFVLFLALPIDLSAPFGGLPVVGAVVAVGFWLWVLHIIVLMGYVLACETDRLLRERDEARDPTHAGRDPHEGSPGPDGAEWQEAKA